MKGIILAGGTGSRLRPITYVLNKNLLPVYNKPALYYSIELLREAGIDEICIVAEYKYIEDYKVILGNGTDFDIRIDYISDTPHKKGPASAIEHAKYYVNGDSCVVLFADGIYDACIREQVQSFVSGANIFVKKVDDSHRFGIVEFDAEGRVLSIEEKPEHPKSSYAFTGLAIYDAKLFDYIDMIQPGLNGEYYTTAVDQMYLEAGKLRATVLDGFWQDMGTFDGLLKASTYWYKKEHGKMVDV